MISSDCSKCLFKQRTLIDSTMPEYGDVCYFEGRLDKLVKNGASVIWGDHNRLDRIENRKCSYYTEPSWDYAQGKTLEEAADNARKMNRTRIFAYLYEEDPNILEARILELMDSNIYKITVVTKNLEFMGLLEQFRSNPIFSILHVADAENLRAEAEKHFNRIKFPMMSYYMEVGAQPLPKDIGAFHSNLIKEECVQAPIMWGGDWCIIQAELLKKCGGFSYIDDNDQPVHPLQVLKDWARDNDETQYLYEYKTP